MDRASAELRSALKPKQYEGNRILRAFDMMESAHSMVEYGFFKPQGTQWPSPKRTKILPCEVHHPTFKNNRYYVVVGLFSDEPYEVFTGINHDSEGEIVIPKSVKEGDLVKKSRGSYCLDIVKDTEEKSFTLTNGHSDDMVDAMTRLISTSLRHGVDISFIVHQLEKTKGDLKSFSKVIARTLKKYIQDGTKVSGEKCASCGSEQIVRQEGCLLCKSCGASGCS